MSVIILLLLLPNIMRMTLCVLNILLLLFPNIMRVTNIPISSSVKGIQFFHVFTQIHLSILSRTSVALLLMVSALLALLSAVTVFCMSFVWRNYGKR